MNNPIEIDKTTKFNITLEFLILIIAGVVSTMAVYYKLSADIEEAKQLPKPTVTTEEYQLKDQLLRTTIDNIDRKVEKIDQRLEKMEEKLMR
jgi:replication fork clamp-binding protein CrfC